MSSIGQGSISIDDSTRIGENAQDTANKVAGNVNDINSDNKLTPSEKLKLKQEYDKNVELYKIDIEQLKSVNLPTAELETAMSNLTVFVTPLFKEMNVTSTVDRDTLNSVFTAFATADKNSSQAFVDMVHQVADGAKKAGDDAKEAGEQAQAAGEAASQAASQAQVDATQAATIASQATSAANNAYNQARLFSSQASSEIAVQSTATARAQSSADNAFSQAQAVGSQASSAIAVQSEATAKAQSTADNAFSQAKTAIDNGKVTSQAVTNLKDGSTLTIAQLGNGLASKVANSDFTSYKTQTANQIGQMVTNSTFSAYQQTTADLIAQKVATKDFSAYQATTAKEISSKVESSDFNTYKSQTADMISSKVSSTDFNNLKVGSRNLYLNSKEIKDGYGAIGGVTVTVEPFDSTTNMWHIVSGQGNGEKVGIYLWDYGNGKLPNSSDWSFSADVKGIGKAGWFGVEIGDHNQTIGTVGSEWSRISQTGRFDNPKYKTIVMYFDSAISPVDVYIKLPKLETGNMPTDWTPAPEDQATKSQITQLSGEIEQKVDNGDFSTYKTQTAQLIESRVDNGTYQSDKTQTADLISQAVKKNDVVNQINISNEGILIDGKKVRITGNTSIDNAVIKNAMIANAAINTAQIADGAINNAKIANAAIDDAKINSLNGNKIIARSVTANQINVDDLIANGINTKTLTSVILNTSTLTTPNLDLGLNGTFTEDFDYTQPTSMFLPKKNKGTLTFNHGVLQSKGNMQTYVNGKWGGMNDNYTFQAGIDNSQWTEVAPGYIKFDLFKQNDIDVAERTFIDPTGYYYTSRNGITNYFGNILQVSQVQTPSVFAKYVGPTDGKSLLQIGSNGNHYGLQVGPYAGNEAVLSDFIYDSTTSGSPNINITQNGHLVRSTSASKYKYNIKNPDVEETLGDRLLNVHLATWNDKRAVDSYAEQLSTGKEREKSSIGAYYGLIAEQLRDAGLDMFITYGKDHEIEGIQYDRAWIPLLSVIRKLNNKVNEYESRISKLEGKING